MKAPGFETLTTHIFDPDDPYINSDAVFGVKESLLAEFTKVDDAGRAAELGFKSWFWDVDTTSRWQEQEKPALRKALAGAQRAL